MIIIFLELKQNWVIKVRLNPEFLQPKMSLEVSSNIVGAHFNGVYFISNPNIIPPSSA